MILNSYAVLDVFLSSLRLVLALLVLGLGALAWRAARRPLTPEGRRELEDRSYLLFLMGLLLLGLNLASWPLLYLLLQSYVREWPGVMCVYGVTRIGIDSIGPSRFLPPLLTFLQWAKPALVFCSGAWFVLYLLNRRTQTAPLLGRILALLVFLGLVAAADAAAELAYLLIPKQEEFPSLGCCTAAFDDPSHGVWLAPGAVLGVGDRPGLSAAYFATNALMAVGLIACLRRIGRANLLGTLTPLLAASLAALAVNAAFLVEVAAPVVLRLPYHHCPYDLIPEAPEAVLGAGLFVWGTFAVGWAWVAAFWGVAPESRALVPGTVRAILAMGLFCYLGSVVLMTVELVLA